MTSAPARRVLVTGGGTGIGRAITRAFLGRGDHVAIGQSTAERAERAATELHAELGAEAAPSRLAAIGADLARPADCARLVAAAAAALGGLDVVVNNAAVSGRPVLRSVAAHDDELIDRVVDVNLKAPLRIVREALAHLPRGGVVVNIGSVGGFAAQEHAAAYCASKGGLELLTRTLALELADAGIRVVGVAPGDIATGRSDAAAEERESASLGRYVRRTPAGRRGTGADVASAVVWAASSDAAFVTGTTIVVDGGFLAY